MKSKTPLTKKTSNKKLVIFRPVKIALVEEMKASPAALAIAGGKPYTVKALKLAACTRKPWKKAKAMKPN